LSGAKYQISRNGGGMPVWSPDGKRLFFRKPISRRLVSVRIRTQPSFSVDDAVALGVDGLVTDAGYDLVPGRGLSFPYLWASAKHQAGARVTKSMSS
jgi:hypothetical protein